ncbi:MAG: hypothetical protein RLZZ450_6154 [Pseudomonadota bacterium]|jgi:hypothetical protein
MSISSFGLALVRGSLGAALLMTAAGCESGADGSGDLDNRPEPSGAIGDSGEKPRVRDAQVGADAGTKGPSRDAAAEAEPSEPSPPGELPADAGRPRGERDASADGGSAEAPHGDAGSGDGKSFAAMLDALFIDVPCAPSTPTPIAKMATCQHPGTTQHIDRKLAFGGTPGTSYDVKLRVRGIWEPTFIKGGTRPLGKLPFTVGGTVATGSGDPINYQQYFITVSEPKQTYWLNDYQYVAHDIHKEDYEATFTVSGGGGASVTVSMSDGNDHQIANWTGDFFQGLTPYDKAPSTGQLLRLDVVSVTPH